MEDFYARRNLLNKGRYMRVKRMRKKGLVKQFPKGRVCKKYGCKRTLSVYNAEQYCYVHLTEHLD